MQKYYVTARKVLVYEVEVEAASFEEAARKADALDLAKEEPASSHWEDYDLLRKDAQDEVPSDLEEVKS